RCREGSSARPRRRHPAFSFRGYDGRSDLHVGITNSSGVVYNYDAEGVRRDHAGWEQCVSVPLVQPGMVGLLQQWDELLEEFSVGEAWQPHRYEEQAHNCYTFALAFINSILMAQGKRQLSKREFTEKFVIPQMRKASRYLTLHQALAANDFYIVPLPERETSEENDALLDESTHSTQEEKDRSLQAPNLGVYEV
ncbi:PREDICTED: MKRN2 opposite strand protein, partial [Merops nubicus]|uniref:MKRN2 opposite strand protein n=1 Tax=Merops nubicus TaxID=57421 RepID=UPI0004F034D0